SSAITTGRMASRNRGACQRTSQQTENRSRPCSTRDYALRAHKRRPCRRQPNTSGRCNRPLHSHTAGDLMAKRPAKQSRRGRNTKLSAFDTFRIEGALLQPELVERIVNLEAADQAEADYGLDPKEKLRDVAATKFSLAQSLHARFVSSDMGPQAA